MALAVQACGSATAHGHSAVRGNATSGSRAAGSKISARFFGLHAPLLATAFPKAKAGAVDLTLNGVYWPDLETSSGVFDFSHLDTLVDQAHAHHAQPLLVLGQTPVFHSTSPGSPQVGATVPDLAAWKTYVGQLVDRYGTRIDYEIWPEADIASNWSGTPRQLAELVIAAAKVIHHAAPRATVVSPAMVLRLPYEQHFMKRLFAQKVGGKRIGHYVDAVGIDAYPLQAGTPEDSLSLIRQAQHILAKREVSAPVWNVEMNYGVVGGNNPIPHHSGAAKQASYVVRNFVLDAAAGIERVYWFDWGRLDVVDIEMVRPDGVTPTAAGRAYSLVEKWLAGQRVKACQQSRKSHVYACTTSRGGHTSWIYWVPKGRRTVRAPKGARHVQSVNGRVTRTHHHQKIKLTSSPVRVYH
ncbi:MAG: hypothetical protein WB797_13310 [Nocardioides sp.]